MIVARTWLRRWRPVNVRARAPVIFFPVFILSACTKSSTTLSLGVEVAHEDARRNKLGAAAAAVVVLAQAQPINARLVRLARRTRPYGSRLLRNSLRAPSVALAGGQAHTKSQMSRARWLLRCLAGPTRARQDPPIGAHATGARPTQRISVARARRLFVAHDL